MRLSISFKVPKKYVKNFSNADKKTIREFKKMTRKKLQPEFEKVIEGLESA